MLGKAKGVNYQQLPNRKKQFYDNLPDRFKRKEAQEIGRKLEIPTRSIDRYLKHFLEKKLKQEEYGVYQKI